MCRVLIQWWQSRTVLAGEGSTAFAGPFSQWVYVIVPLQVLGDGGAQEPEWLHCSHSAVHDGEWRAGGVFLESMIISTVLSSIKLQVVKTAPDSQLHNLLSVSRLVTVLDEADQCGVVCKLQELDQRGLQCAVVRVQEEEQWGENTVLRSSSADCTGCWMYIFLASLAAACLSWSCWSTDRWRWARRAELVWAGGVLGQLC